MFLSLLSHVAFPPFPFPLLSFQHQKSKKVSCPVLSHLPFWHQSRLIAVMKPLFTYLLLGLGLGLVVAAPTAEYDESTVSSVDVTGSRSAATPKEISTADSKRITLCVS
jgi:hypothetical protein